MLIFGRKMVNFDHSDVVGSENVPYIYHIFAQLCILLTHAYYCCLIFAQKIKPVKLVKLENLQHNCISAKKHCTMHFRGLKSPFLTFKNEQNLQNAFLSAPDFV